MQVHVKNVKGGGRRFRRNNPRRSRLSYTSMTYFRELAIEYKLDRGNRVGCCWFLYNV